MDPLHFVKKLDIFWWLFSGCKPVFWTIVSLVSAAVPEYLSPQHPGTDFEACAMYCHFSHPFSFQTFTQMMLFWNKWLVFDFPLCFFPGSETVHRIFSVLVDLQSVLFKCSEIKAYPIGLRTNVGLLQHRLSFWQFDLKTRSAVVNALNKKFT